MWRIIPHLPHPTFQGQVHSQSQPSWLVFFQPTWNWSWNFLVPRNDWWLIKSPSFKKKKKNIGNFHRHSPTLSDRLYKSCLIKQCSAIIVGRNVPSAFHKQELIDSPTPRCIQISGNKKNRQMNRQWHRGVPSGFYKWLFRWLLVVAYVCCPFNESLWKRHKLNK